MHPETMKDLSASSIDSGCSSKFISPSHASSNISSISGFSKEYEMAMKACCRKVTFSDTVTVITFMSPTTTSWHDTISSKKRKEAHEIRNSSSAVGSTYASIVGDGSKWSISQNGSFANHSEKKNQDHKGKNHYAVAR